jgi:hypothetical protein
MGMTLRRFHPSLRGAQATKQPSFRRLVDCFAGARNDEEAFGIHSNFTDHDTKAFIMPFKREGTHFQLALAAGHHRHQPLGIYDSRSYPAFAQTPFAACFGPQRSEQ